MRSESGFVCVVADHDMVDKITKISDAVYSLVYKEVADNHHGKFNYIRTRKRRFFKDQEITLFDHEKFEREFHALVDPIRFCYASHSKYLSDNNIGLCAGCSEYNILKTGSYYGIGEIRRLITNPMCTLYLTPSQASLWKKIEAADINLYLEEAKNE